MAPPRPSARDCARVGRCVCPESCDHLQPQAHRMAPPAIRMSCRAVAAYHQGPQSCDSAQSGQQAGLTASAMQRAHRPGCPRLQQPHAAPAVVFRAQRA